MAPTTIGAPQTNQTHPQVPKRNLNCCSSSIGNIVLSLSQPTTMPIEADTRRVKRARKDDETAAAAASSPKSPMEESVDALAGVEGAIGSASKSTKRKAASPSSSSSKKKAAVKSDIRDRSNSIDQLVSVAGSLLADPTATAAAIAESSANQGDGSKADSSSDSNNVGVPNPMAASTLVVAAASMPALPKAAKPRAKKPKAATAATTTTTTATKSTAASALSASAQQQAAADAKKAQIQYNPDIPMTKEQLTAWRREMRRVRNRESAAASRRKVRDRIEELEEEVNMWKMRYGEVMERLARSDGGGGKSEEL